MSRLPRHVTTETATRMPPGWTWLLGLVVLGAAGYEAAANKTHPANGTAASSVSSKTSSQPSRAPRSIKKELFAGQVVLLQDALRKRGVKSSSEFANQVVLESSTGELIPIIPDWRGRAFYQDKRLRNRPVELVGYRRKGVPYLQVLMVFTIDPVKSSGANKTPVTKPATVRNYFDYWCDICSIPMYEIKRCECCQGPIRLRFQPRALPDYLRARKPTP